jgi:hypothetical protein
MNPWIEDRKYRRIPKRYRSEILENWLSAEATIQNLRGLVIKKDRFVRSFGIANWLMMMESLIAEGERLLPLRF